MSRVLSAAVAGNADTNWVKKDFVYKDFSKFSLRPFLAWPGLSITLSDKNGPGYDIVYRPNLQESAGIDIQLAALRFSLAFHIPPSTYNQEKKGNTRYFQTQLNYRLKQSGIQLSIIHYKGFYLSNPKNLIDNWEPDLPFPSFQNMRLFRLHVFSWYCFSDRFSMKAPFLQSEIQKKSAGSAVIMLIDKLSQLTNNQSLAPLSQSRFYPELLELKHQTANSIFLVPAYGYTLVYNEYYFSAIGGIGGGLRLGVVKAWHSHLMTQLCPATLLKIAAGFNTQHWFGRITLNWDNEYFNYKQVRFSVSATTWNVGAGIKW